MNSTADHDLTVIAWTKKQLIALGYKIIDGPIVVRDMPWSKVSLFKTQKGLVYLKQMAAPFAIEPKILQFIHENFSTADVKLGVPEESNNLLSNMKIGSVLKMADKLGFIPNAFETNNNLTNINENNLINITNESSFDQMPDLSKLMNIITKLIKLCRVFKFLIIILKLFYFYTVFLVS